MHAGLYVCMPVHVCVHVHELMFACVCICMSLCVHICACARVCLGEVVATAQTWAAGAVCPAVGQEPPTLQKGLALPAGTMVLSPYDCKVQAYNLILNLQFV